MIYIVRNHSQSVESHLQSIVKFVVFSSKKNKMIVGIEIQ